MKRSVLALGASVLALALGAGPAQAAPGATQSVDDTTGAAQVGAVAIDAPVRVASDGDSQSAGAAVAGPQTTSDSTGGAQVSSADANAPVRVLSDGDAAPADDSAGVTGGPQAVGDSSGAAQVGSPRLFAPVRVLGGGRPPGPDGSGVAGEVGALLGTLEGVQPGGDALSTVATIASRLLGDAVGGGDGPTPQGTRGLRDRGAVPYTRPVVNLYSGGAAVPGDGSDVGDISTLGAAGRTLPFTGAGLAALVAMGLSLLSSGAALRRIS